MSVKLLHRIATLEADVQMANARIEHENRSGGEARLIVMDIARVVGVDLVSEPLDGNVWSPANMRRVQAAVQSLRAQNAVLRGLPLRGFGDSVHGQQVPMSARGW